MRARRDRRRSAKGDTPVDLVCATRVAHSLCEHREQGADLVFDVGFGRVDQGGGDFSSECLTISSSEPLDGG